jgi:serine/threonine protein kinase
VNYCHCKGIAHRDIKTENILMTTTDTSAPIEIKLIDFGLACPFNMPEVKNKVVGTMLYMAPEILKKKCNYDGKEDMWAVGIVFYMILTGCIPYMEKDMGRLAETIR